MSCKLKDALKLIDRGFYIFPLKSNSKEPLIKWRDGSTNDKKKVEEWYQRQEPNIAIDTGKSGLCVIDVDDKIIEKRDKDGEKIRIIKEGRKTMRELEEAGCAFPDTLMVETPSGGLHFYYRSEGLRNSANTFAKDIDVRAEGGFVLAPGSSLNGETYKIILPETRIVPLPLWAQERCEKAVPREDRKAEVVLSEDAPVDEDWAVTFLKTYPEAVQGAAGDLHTYKMFCHLKEHGLSMQNAVDLADKHWNEKCQPRWDIEELTEKAENAYAYAHNATGSHSPEYEFNEPQIIIPEKPRAHPVSALSEGYLKRTESLDGSLIPKRPWAFGNIALEGQITTEVAPGGTGKSTFSINIALSKASGKELLGMDPRGIGRVAIYNNEDNLEEMYRREAAARQLHELSVQDISDEEGSRIFYGTGDNHMLRVINKARDGKLVEEKDVQILIDQVLKEKIKILIIDPLAETHNVDENNNVEMLQVMQVFRRIAQVTRCAVILIHHTRKKDKAASDGHSGNMDSLRGASSIASLSRIVITLDTMSGESAKKYLKDPNDRFKYVELMFAKANMSLATGQKFFYEKVSVSIGADNMDGEEVGALKHVAFSEVKRDLSADDKAMLRALGEVVGSETMKLSDAADKLVKSNPFQSNVSPQTITKKVPKMFNGKTEIDLGTGILHCFKDMLDNRHAYLLRYVSKIESIL